MSVFRFERCLCTMACVLLAGIAGAADTETAAHEKTAVPDKTDGANPDTAGPANLRFNFRGVPLDTVLDYLSEAAGFTVIREATVEGRVDIVSMQPLDKDEAVELLNSVLNDRGYAAIRNRRILTIVKSEDAKKKNIPVRSGAAPESIPATSEMVTQVIPVRHADVTQLLENLKPLLPSYAVANANESSNAIVITDTQADVKRMAEIINALDTSIAAISEIHVFPLTYANAADAANLINALFQLPASQGAPATPAARKAAGAAAKAPAPAAEAKAESAAKVAASRVVAVGDDRTNSVVISAPQDTMPLIETIVKELDTVGVAGAEIRVFALQYSDAAETSQIINDAFGSNAAVGSANAPQPARPQGKAAAARAPGKPGTQPGQNVNLAHAVADLRTNSVVVTASKETMSLVETIIEELDRVGVPAAEIRVFALKYSDAAEMAQILNDAFGPNATVSSASGPQPARTPPKTAAGPAASKAGSQSRQNITLAHAVPDLRTNSIVVTADAETMEQVAKMIEKLEDNPARDQKVFMYKLKNADAEDVANILIGMLAQPGSNVNRPRPATPARPTSPGSIRRNGSGSSSRRGSTSLTGR